MSRRDDDVKIRASHSGDDVSFCLANCSIIIFRSLTIVRWRNRKTLRPLRQSDKVWIIGRFLHKTMSGLRMIHNFIIFKHLSTVVVVVYVSLLNIIKNKLEAIWNDTNSRRRRQTGSKLIIVAPSAVERPSSSYHKSKWKFIRMIISYRFMCGKKR